jgi:hypothetical protein
LIENNKKITEAIGSYEYRNNPKDLSLYLNVLYFIYLERGMILQIYVTFSE